MAGDSSATGRTPARSKLSTRSKARKHALDILFAAELLARDPGGLLAEQVAASDPPVREFTQQLVRGVIDHAAEIDTRIRTVLAPGWTLERMPRVDRIAARICVFEIGYTDVATAVAVSEAVALASDLSTDESPDFLSGLLGQIAEPADS